MSFRQQISIVLTVLTMVFALAQPVPCLAAGGAPNLSPSFVLQLMEGLQPQMNAIREAIFELEAKIAAKNARIDRDYEFNPSPPKSRDQISHTIWKNQIERLTEMYNEWRKAWHKYAEFLPSGQSPPIAVTQANRPIQPLSTGAEAQGRPRRVVIDWGDGSRRTVVDIKNPKAPASVANAGTPAGSSPSPSQADGPSASGTGGTPSGGSSAAGAGGPSGPHSEPSPGPSRAPGPSTSNAGGAPNGGSKAVGPTGPPDPYLESWPGPNRPASPSRVDAQPEVPSVGTPSVEIPRPNARPTGELELPSSPTRDLAPPSTRSQGWRPPAFPSSVPKPTPIRPKLRLPSLGTTLKGGLGAAGTALSAWEVWDEYQNGGEWRGEAVRQSGAVIGGAVGANYGSAAGPWGALAGGIAGGIGGHMGASSLRPPEREPTIKELTTILEGINRNHPEFLVLREHDGTPFPLPTQVHKVKENLEAKRDPFAGVVFEQGEQVPKEIYEGVDSANVLLEQLVEEAEGLQDEIDRLKGQEKELLEEARDSASSMTDHRNVLSGPHPDDTNKIKKRMESAQEHLNDALSQLEPSADPWLDLHDRVDRARQKVCEAAREFLAANDDEPPTQEEVDAFRKANEPAIRKAAADIAQACHDQKQEAARGRSRLENELKRLEGLIQDYRGQLGTDLSFATDARKKLAEANERHDRAYGLHKNLAQQIKRLTQAYSWWWSADDEDRVLKRRADDVLARGPAADSALLGEYKKIEAEIEQKLGSMGVDDLSPLEAAKRAVASAKERLAELDNGDSLDDSAAKPALRALDQAKECLSQVKDPEEKPPLVPNVVGKTEDEANRILKKHGLWSFQNDYSKEDPDKAGLVWRQSPEADQSLIQPIVKLFVYKKPKSVSPTLRPMHHDLVIVEEKPPVMPKVLGKKLSKATEMILEEGIPGHSISSRPRTNASPPLDRPGCVCHQTPAPGEPVLPGQEVKLCIYSKGVTETQPAAEHVVDESQFTDRASHENAKIVQREVARKEEHARQQERADNWNGPGSRNAPDGNSSLPTDPTWCRGSASTTVRDLRTVSTPPYRLPAES